MWRICSLDNYLTWASGNQLIASRWLRLTNTHCSEWLRLSKMHSLDNYDTFARPPSPRKRPQQSPQGTPSQLSPEKWIFIWTCGLGYWSRLITTQCSECWQCEEYVVWIIISRELAEISPYPANGIRKTFCFICWEGSRGRLRFRWWLSLIRKWDEHISVADRMSYNLL